MHSKLLYVLLSCGFYAGAQQTDSVSTSSLPHLTASADAYYRYNFNAPANATNSITRFTRSQNSFELGMASIGLSHHYKKVSALVDVGFGRRAEELNYVEGNRPSLVAVKQAYVSYQPSERLSLSFGKFFANTGYERVDAWQNNHYSTSYLFTYGPLFFTGLKAEVRIVGHTYLMAGLCNPADFTTTTSSVKTAIARLRTSNESGTLQLQLHYTGYSGLATPRLLTANYLLYRSLNQWDLTVRDSVSRHFIIGATGMIQSVDDGTAMRRWGGAALYLSFLPNGKSGVHLRTEYLSDVNVIKLGGKVFETTLSGDFRIDNHLRFIPELRYDKGTLNIFQQDNFLGRNNTFTLLAAAVYRL